jgi:3-deoxy-D-manno-octulosonic acid kinase
MQAAGIDAIRLVEHRARRVRVFLNPRCAPSVCVEDLLRLPEVLAGLPGRPTRQRGRPTSWHWRPAWAGGAGLFVRLYAHGGLLGPVLGTGFLNPRRISDELRVAILAYERGVPTALPVAVRIERTAGPLFTAHYVSEAIPDAVSLLALLSGTGQDPTPSPEAVRRLAVCAGDTVAALHEAGIWHADLSLGNLVVQGTLDAPRVFVIDFDKARPSDGIRLRRRIANLVRLNRSVLKWPGSRQAVRPRDRLRFLRAYARRCSDGDRGDWRQVARRCDA